MKSILEQLSKNRPLKSSRRRNAIIEAFSRASEHLTVDELYERARQLDPKVGYTTVWRTLKLLESLGLASSQKFHDGQTRYEYVSSKQHHDHLICIGCGQLQEFINPKIEEIQKQIAAAHKFQITSHKMELYGYCTKCSPKNLPRRSQRTQR
jgi:Fur family ferric uptake transcriptional regulator